MSISVQDKQQAVLISIAACCLETAQGNEPPHSFRANKINAALAAIKKATDDYKGEGFIGEDMVKAEAVYEVTRKAIEKLYAPPKVKRHMSERVRGRDGRFMPR